MATEVAAHDSSTLSDRTASLYVGSKKTSKPKCGTTGHNIHTPSFRVTYALCTHAVLTRQLVSANESRSPLQKVPAVLCHAVLC
jgi:hypothetical protein